MAVDEVTAEDSVDSVERVLEEVRGALVDALSAVSEEAAVSLLLEEPCSLPVAEEREEEDFVLVATDNVVEEVVFLLMGSSLLSISFAIEASNDGSTPRAVGDACTVSLSERRTMG